ncbi:hypothetical protein LguiA_026001 [Lonicera macranthoides]
MAEIYLKVELADFSGDKLRKLVGNEFSPILQHSRHQLDVCNRLTNRAVDEGFCLGLIVDLEKIWEMKPLLNGNDIINVLDLKGGGPLIGELVRLSISKVEICVRKKVVMIYCDCMYDAGCLWQQKKLVEQQLLRRCRNRDECIEWLKQTHPKCSEKFDTVTKPSGIRPINGSD